MGTIRYSQFHCNNAFQKSKAITLNSVEIKIVRTGTKILSEEFYHWVISFKEGGSGADKGFEASYWGIQGRPESVPSIILPQPKNAQTHT